MKINLKSVNDLLYFLESTACGFSHILAIFPRYFELLVLPTFHEVIFNSLDWRLKRQIN